MPPTASTTSSTSSIPDSSFWSTTWHIVSLQWLWPSGYRARSSLAPPIGPGTFHMVVKDRTEPPNWGGVTSCNCSDVEQFWGRSLLAQDPPTSSSWTTVKPKPEGNPLRRFWVEMGSTELERPSQISQLWKQTQMIQDRQTGDSCTTTLYVRDIELFLSHGNQWQLPRRGPPSIIWLSSPSPTTPPISSRRRSPEETVLKPIPKSATTWEKGWTWKPIPGLTKLPETNWFAELSTEKYDRERLVRELESANKNLQKTAWQMERTTMSLAGISPGIMGLTASLMGLSVELDRVRSKMDRIARRVEDQANRAGNRGNHGSSWEREQSPPAYSPRG